MKRLPSRLPLRSAAVVVAAAISLGAFMQPAGASDLAARHPNDGGTYSAAAYQCAIGYNNYHRQWPSLRNCMDYYLATHVRNADARSFHVVQLYIYYRYDLNFWTKAWTLASLYGQVFKAWGEVFTSYYGIAACTYVGSVSGPAAGVACDVGLTSAMIYYGF